ncbi:hypothetical protein AB0R01_14715 [Streptomyces rochei]|uniref:hypothetical protein n=1 Tax=Streptomyces rochei TaxID=1928 RepID=UPI003420E4F0
MTETTTRPVPSPLTVAAAMRATPTPAPRQFNRDAWLAAIMTSDLHPNARHIGHALAAHADAHGDLPAGGIQHAHTLATLTGLTPRSARVSINVLEKERYIQRPDIHTWEGAGVRPVTLVIPVRSRPDHDHQAEQLQ